MNKGAAEMDEGSGERQRGDRDGWSEQRPGLYGGEGGEARLELQMHRRDPGEGGFLEK